MFVPSLILAAAFSIAFNASQSGYFTIEAEPMDALYSTREFGLLSVEPNAIAEKARIAKMKAEELELVAYKPIPNKKPVSELTQPLPEIAKTEEESPGKKAFDKYACGACHLRNPPSPGARAGAT